MQMDALDQFLQIEKFDPTQVLDESMKYKGSKYQEVIKNVDELDSKGKSFIKDASDAHVRLNLLLHLAIDELRKIENCFDQRLAKVYAKWLFSSLISSVMLISNI